MKNKTTGQALLDKYFEKAAKPKRFFNTNHFDSIEELFFEHQMVSEELSVHNEEDHFKLSNYCAIAIPVFSN